MCGEKVFKPVGRDDVEGSPPRVRGEALNCNIAICDERITPACAGRSDTDTTTGAYVKDHPRVCGEKSRSFSRPPRRSGSPPRVRGEDTECTKHHVVLGITPACAGRSCRTMHQQKLYQDHPRVRGEKVYRLGHPRPVGGSPPRARGEGRGRKSRSSP